jgi:hypothetical protein
MTACAADLLALLIPRDYSFRGLMYISSSQFPIEELLLGVRRFSFNGDSHIVILQIT